MTGIDCRLSREFHVDAGWFVGTRVDPLTTVNLLGEMKCAVHAFVKYTHDIDTVFHCQVEDQVLP